MAFKIAPTSLPVPVLIVTWMEFPDECGFAPGASDCDQNGTPDICELDCDMDGVPDACAIAANQVPDCDLNGVSRFPVISPLVEIRMEMESWMPVRMTSSSEVIATAVDPILISRMQSVHSTMSSNPCPSVVLIAAM